MKNLLILVLVGMVTFSSCKKYEEGPLVSVHSAQSRLTNSWQYDAVYRNGLNVTKGEGTTEINYARSSIGFDKTGRFSLIYDTDSGEVEQDGFWNFSENKELVNLDYIDEVESDRVLTLLRLTKSELFFSEEIDNIVYEYQCSPN